MSLDSVLKSDVSIGGVGFSEKIFFARHLSLMLRSGVPILEALRIVYDSSEGKFHSIISTIARSVESGKPLSAALANYPRVFPELFVSAVYAGERSGTLVENLEHVALALEKERSLRSKIKSAMTYPIIVFAVAGVLAFVFSFYILPRVIPLFEGLRIELPVTTRFLIGFTHFIQAHGIAVLVGLVLFAVGFTWLLRQKFIKPFTHWLLLRTPVVGRISREANLARFSRTLGMLLKSGVAIDEALNIARETVGNYHYRMSLLQVGERIRKGSRLSEVLTQEPKLFPPLLSRMIRVGEESGRFEETLFYLADFYEEALDASTKTLATAIEPVLLLAIGGVVAFLALSIITPIYNLTGSIKH